MNNSPSDFNMKKLLLIPLLFLITPYAKADMNNVCRVSLPDKWGDTIKYIERYNCERNNILVVSEGKNFIRQNRQEAIAHYCRFDRNVVQTDFGFTCVLYDKKPRTNLERVN